MRDPTTLAKYVSDANVIMLKLTTPSRVHIAPLRLRRQGNGYDGGVFISQYVTYINANDDDDFDFGQNDMQDMRLRMLYSILSWRVILSMSSLVFLCRDCYRFQFKPGGRF